MRLRFSIRDLLLITVIAALAVGWWLDHRALVEQPRVVVYPIKTTSADMVAKILQVMTNAHDDVRLSVDERNNSVVVSARPAQQAVIRDLIVKLEAGQLSLQGRPIVAAPAEVPKK